MGCVSSRLFRKEDFHEKPVTIISNGGAGQGINHVVSLTSSTYGVLKLEKEQPPIKECVTVSESKRSQRSPPREDPEVINAWELMEGLEEGSPIGSNQAKKTPLKTPSKFLSQIGSPRKGKKSVGKENKGNANGLRFYTPKQVFRERNSPDESRRAVFSLRIPRNGTPVGSKRDSFGCDSSRRRSLSPLFDPELIASYEKELSEKGEQIKRMVSVSPFPKSQIAKNSKISDSFLETFEKKCPPGGENSVILYTTTLRGIRKTFEDCNALRSIVESHLIQTYERDISMDSGFKEELRKLMGTKEVKVPILFVRGRLIGGVDQVLKMEEEGKLGLLFDGIPRATKGCEGCGGMRFVMCMECNGSCKVLAGDKKKMVRCSECNENGLIHCPICC